MSNLRNIIARRRPSVPGAGGTSAPTHPREPLVLTDPVTSDAPQDAETEVSSEGSQSAVEVPSWSIPKPRKTMETLGQPTQDAAAQSQPEASQPKIWDLERPASVPGQPATPSQAPSEPAAGGQMTRLVAASGPPAVEAPEVPEVVAPAPAHARAPVSSERPRTGRVKTRLLGFHSDDLIPDAFAAEMAPAAPASMLCPVGWVVVVDGPGRGHSFALGSGLSMIGRGDDQTISLDFGDTSISRDNHASIAYDEEDNKVLIGHGGKSNLVRLNGTPLLSTEELQNADHIRIGKTTLRYVALCGADFSWTVEGDGLDGAEHA